MTVFLINNVRRYPYLIPEELALFGDPLRLGRGDVDSRGRDLLAAEMITPCTTCCMTCHNT